MNKQTNKLHGKKTAVRKAIGQLRKVLKIISLMSDSWRKLMRCRTTGAMLTMESDASAVKGYSVMRPYPVVSGHQRRLDSYWSPVINAYCDASDTEDTGAGTCYSTSRHLAYGDRNWPKLFNMPLSTVCAVRWYRSYCTFMLSQSTPPYCAIALPAEHVRVPGLFGRRSYFVELYLIVFANQHRVLTVFEEMT